MKKALYLLLAAVLILGALAGCATDDPGTAAAEETATFASKAEMLEAYGLDENLRFLETRHITVEIYDRNNSDVGGTDPTNNVYTDFIKEGMLRDHNVEVEFVPVPRWEEVATINNMLAANEAPDVCVTYDYPQIQSYGLMDAIVNLTPYLDAGGEELFPNMWAVMGRTNIYWNQDPVDGHIWAMEAMLYNNMRTNTFVREDWLAALDMELPTTEAEFEAMLIAFRDNAELLLGEDADQMVPFATSRDVAWDASRLIESYFPDEMTDREFYIKGIGDRRLFFPGVKEATRVLNKWYNEGLMDPDFALYETGNDIFTNKFKAGYVGAYIGNWDLPYRDGDLGVTGSMHAQVGPEANFIAVDSFPNNAGVDKKYLSAPVDRKVFFPATNDEPVASLLYVDWISRPDVRFYLQLGTEGINYEVTENGAYQNIPTDTEHFINSAQNIDYTITINGLDVGDPAITALSMALGYAGVEPRLIETSYVLQKTNFRIGKQVSVGVLASEDGLGTVLTDKGYELFAKSIVAAPEEFDAVYDQLMGDLMTQYGDASQAERAEKFQQYYGDVEMLP